MEISIGTGYSQSLANRLTPSDQKLTAQPLSDAAKTALNNASPAAVYHPSDVIPTDAQTEPMVVIETWVGRSQSADFPKMAAAHRASTEALKSSFEEFKSALAYVFPDLASKKYGFTVEADGKLKVLNTGGQLTASDTERLNTLLNASSELKATANAYRDTAIDLVDADSPWSGSYLGRYNLTKENFATSLDLAALFIPKTTTPSKEQVDGMFFNQLAYKGELATRETEAAMLAARAAKKAAAAA